MENYAGIRLKDEINNEGICINFFGDYIEVKGSSLKESLHIGIEEGIEIAKTIIFEYSGDECAENVDLNKDDNTKQDKAEIDLQLALESDLWGYSSPKIIYEAFEELHWHEQYKIISKFLEKLPDDPESILQIIYNRSFTEYQLNVFCECLSEVRG